MGLLKAVMRLSMTSLKGADAKDIASSVTAIANEKIKAEKEANAGKKKTGKFILDALCFCSIFVDFVSFLLGVFVVFILQVARKSNLMLTSLMRILYLPIDMMLWMIMISCENFWSSSIHIQLRDST